MKNKILQLFVLTDIVNRVINGYQQEYTAVLLLSSNEENIAETERAEIIQMTEEIKNVIETERELITDKLIALYEEYFDESEIDSLIEFFSTHLGEKYAKRHNVQANDIADFNLMFGNKVKDKVQALLNEESDESRIAFSTNSDF